MLSSWRYISSLALVFSSSLTYAQSIVTKSTSIHQSATNQFGQIQGDILVDGEIAQMDAYVRPGQLTPITISFKAAVSTNIPLNAEKDAFIEASLDIISDLNSQLHIVNVQDELKCLSVQKSKRYTHVTFKQQYQGIDVYGGEIKVHFNEKNELFLVNNSAIASPTSMLVAPTYSAKEAMLLAGINNQTSQHSSLYPPTAKLVIGSHFGLNLLCWKINYVEDLQHNWEVLIAAHSGAEIHRVNTTCHGTPVTVNGVKGFDLRRNVTTDIDIETYKVGNTYYLFDGSAKEVVQSAPIPSGGGIMVWDAKKTNSPNLGQYNFEIKEPSSGTLSERWNEIYGSDKAFQIAATCQHNLKTTFNYYATGNNILTYRGFDGINSVPIKAYINVGSYNQKGSDDAFWFSNKNDQFMVFGSGRYLFKQLGAALDVVAHEYTHALVEYNAKLGSQNDAGSINEAMADIMAMVISGKTQSSHPNSWQFGAEAIREDINGKTLAELQTHFENIDPTGLMALSAYPYSHNAMRDIADPHNAFSSKKDAGFHCKHFRDIRGEKDEGYNEQFEVYHNSTIISHAFYRLITGKDNRTESGNPITKDAHNTAAIFFNAMRNYLPANPQLIDFAEAVKWAYIEEYGYISTGKNPEWKYAMNAFKAVGLEVSDESEPGVKLQPVIGKNFIITKATGKSGTGVVAYTERFEEKSGLLDEISEPKTTISSTDNGNLGFYIGHEGLIHKLDFTPINSDTLREAQSLYDSLLNLKADLNWNSVSVSPDGKKLALTAEPFDGSIYLYEIERDSLWAYFIAPYYYVQDKDEPAEYPIITRINSLQWNYNGEHILFDCEAELKNQNHLSNEPQFNIGILKIWDAVNNLPDDGDIRAPFGSKKLSYNHYRNPRFAKNRPTLITCDQNNALQKTNWISIYDDSRPNRGIVKLLESRIVSNPCFTHNDNKIAFTSTTAFGDTAINLVDVNLDSMFIIKGSQDQILERKLPSWLTVGYRIGNKVEEPTPPKINRQLLLYPNPAIEHLTIELADGFNRVQIINLNGQTVINERFNDSKKARINVQPLPIGQYVCIIYGNNSVIRRKFVIE